MRARPVLLLLCALLMPAAGLAASIQLEVEVMMTEADDPEEGDYRPAAGVYVQFSCKKGLAAAYPTDEQGSVAFPIVEGQCDFRVVLDPETEEASTVTSFFFEEVEDAFLHLFLDKRGEWDWFLHGYVE